MRPHIIGVEGNAHRTTILIDLQGCVLVERKSKGGRNRGLEKKAGNKKAKTAFSLLGVGHWPGSMALVIVTTFPIQNP